MANIIKITDFAVPDLEIYAKLSEVQLRHYYEPKTGLFIAESPKVTQRALNAGYVPHSFLMESKFFREPEQKFSEEELEQDSMYGEVPLDSTNIPQRAHARSLIERCPDVPVYVADLDVMKQLTGYAITKGMLCAMYRKPLPGVEDVCRGARRIALLEDITNPTNVGAIFRCAAALNMDAVLLTGDCSDPLYRRSIRVSMGSVFQIPWTIFPGDIFWPDEGMKLLKDLGFHTAAMALNDDSLSIDDPRLHSQDKLAVLFGAEGDGLSPDTIAACDYTVRIPMSHGVDSLNVAAASAVAFWELGKK